MRKVDANSLRAEFDADIVEYRDLFTRAAGPFTLAEQSLMAEHTLLAAATRWEGFLSELFIAYINREPAQARASMVGDLKNSASTKFGAVIAGKFHMDAPKHLSRAEVVGMLDPGGRNLTFTDADAIITGASRWLGAVHRAKFTGWSNQDKAAINAWIKLRHFLAHRSVKARTEMNQALGAAHLAQAPNVDLARGADEVSNVGSFLKAAPAQGGPTRVVRYLDRMRGIAGAL